MFIVDCDCHNYWCDARVLEPYLDGLFKDMFVRGERTGPPGAFPHAHRPWFHPEGFARKDINPVNEDDNYLIMKEKHLDLHNIDIAILTGVSLLKSLLLPTHITPQLFVRLIMTT